MLTKKEQRLRRSRQTRTRIALQGTVRLAVHRSNLHIYASIVSDDGTKVLARASTAEKEVRDQLGAAGKGGNVTLYYDGQEVGKGRVEQTQGFIFSADETTDVGYESGTPVSPDYNANTSRFNGKINWVEIALGEDAKDADHFIDHEEYLRVLMARQ